MWKRFHIGPDSEWPQPGLLRATGAILKRGEARSGARKRPLGPATGKSAAGSPVTIPQPQAGPGASAGKGEHPLVLRSHFAAIGRDRVPAAHRQPGDDLPPPGRASRRVAIGRGDHGRPVLQQALIMNSSDHLHHGRELKLQDYYQVRSRPELHCRPFSASQDLHVVQHLALLNYRICPYQLTKQLLLPFLSCNYLLQAIL